MGKYFFIFLFLIYACKISKSNYEEGAFRLDQIELDLMENFSPQRLEAGFSSYGIKYLCQLDKAQNLCVFQVDTSVRALGRMLDFFKNEVGVEGGQKTKGCN